LTHGELARPRVSRTERQLSREVRRRAERTDACSRRIPAPPIVGGLEQQLWHRIVSRL